MKQMTPFQHTPTHKKQAGNVFFAIFGAIAVVGLLGAGLTTFVGGPLSSSVTLTRESAAQNQMVIGAQTALMGAKAQSADGDCDLDMFVEPVPWRVPGLLPAPVGGGLIPSNIPAPKRDPWGTDYGYCVWDHGPTIDDAACGGATQNRLVGANGRSYPSLALISAGPDKTFQTTCADFTAADANSDGDLEDEADGDTKLVYKSAGSDDMIFSYTYEEAVAATGEMWVLKSSDPNTAALDKKIEVAGGAEFSGSGDFIGVSADTFTASAADFINLPGIRIPDSSSYGAACSPALAGVLRTNMSSVSPPAVISSATDAQGFRDANSSSVTFHSRPIAGNTIIVTVRGYDAGGFALPATNVTDSDNNTYVDIGSTAAGTSRVMMFAAYNISGVGSDLTVSINPTGGAASGVLGALEVAGIGSTSLDITGSNVSSNGAVSATGTTAEANAMAIGVIGIFGDDNIDRTITHNSGSNWQQPIVKDVSPAMAVVTKTFPSAASSVSHTWNYDSTSAPPVRKFMAVFSPVSMSGGGSFVPVTATHVVNTYNNNTAGDIITSSFDSTGYEGIVVFTKHEDVATSITVTDSVGSVFTPLTKVSHSNNDLHAQLFWAPLTSTSANHVVTMTLGAWRRYREVSVWLLNADGGIVSLDVESTGQGTGQSQSAGPLATTAPTAMVSGIAGYMIQDFTAGPGWTEDTQVWYNLKQHRNEAAAGTFTATSTTDVWSGDAWAATSAAFRASTGGGGGGGTPPPSGPTMAMDVDWSAVATPINLTSPGYSDWAQWQTASWNATNRMSGGGSLISNATVFGGGAASYYDDGNWVTWSNGTPTASGNTPEGVYNGSATANRGYTITFPADTTTKIAKIFMGRYNADVRITASISDASTPDVIINKALDAEVVGEVSITYQAASAGQTLSVRVQTTTAGGNVALQAAAIDTGNGGLLGTGGGPITRVQQAPGVDSSTSAWVSAVFPSPVTAGNTIIVPITTWNGTVDTVYDDRGNTYTKVLEGAVNNLQRTYVWVANNVAAGPTTINVTSSGGSHKSITAYEFSGLANDTLQLVDQIGHFNTTGGTTSTVTAAGAIDQADELVFAVHGTTYTQNNMNYQVSPGYTQGHAINDTTVSGVTYATAYKVTSATETPSHTWTYNGPTDSWNSVVSSIITFRGEDGLSGGGSGGGGGGGGSPAPTACEDIINAPPLEGGPGSPGAIAVVQKSAKYGHVTWGGISETMTFSTPPQAGNSIVIIAAMNSTSDDFNVSDNQGNRYIQVLNVTPGSEAYSSIYVADNIKAPVGSFEVTVSKSGFQGALTTGMMEVAGLAAVNPRDRYGYGMGTGGTGSTVTTTGATTSANQLVIATHVATNSAPANINYARQGGWTEGFTENAGDTMAGSSSAYRISSSVETPSHAWTYNSLGGGTVHGRGIVTLKGYTDPPVQPVAASVVNQTPLANTNSVSFTRTPTVGSTIIVTIHGWANNDPYNVSGVTDNQGNTYTLIGGSNNPGAYARNIYMYAAYDISPPAGNFTITAATSPAVMDPYLRFMTMSASEVVGLLPSGLDAVQIVSNTGNPAANETLTASGTTAEANEFAIAFAGAIVEANPTYDVMNDPTWRPIQGRMALPHSVVTKEFAAAGSTVAHTWSTYGNDPEGLNAIIATFRTDPDFVFTPATPANPAPSPNAPRMMSSSGALLDSGNLSVAKPAGTNVGDLLIWVVSIDGPGTNPWPYGFTQIEADFVPGPDSHTIGAAWKIADGTEPATFIASSGSYENISFMMRYTGFDTAQPIEASTSKALSGVLPWALTWPADTGSITTTVDNARVVWASVTDHTGLAPDYPVLHVPPAGFTERADLRSGQYSNLGVADKVFPEAGATGPLNGLATDSWNAAGGGAYSIENGTLAFAIRPGDGGGSSDQPGPIEYIGSDKAMIPLAGARGIQNLNVTAPDNIAAGDLIILAQSTDVEVYNGDSSTITWPAGFTEVNEVSGGSQQFNWAWKVADGSEGVMTVSSSDSWAMEVVMSVYRGVDPDDPIGAHSGYLEPADTEFAWPYSVPGITVPNAGSSLVLIPFGDTGFVWGINFGARFFSAPETFVERENRYDNGEAFAPLAVFDRMGVPAGATGNIAGNMINQRMLDPAITGAWAHAGGFLLSLNPDPDPPVAVPEELICTASILEMCDGTQWRSVATSVSGGGVNLDPNNNAVCDSGSSSTVRYNTSALRPEYCNGTNWLPFALNEAGVVLVADTTLLAGVNSVNDAWSTTRIVTITNRGSVTSGMIGTALTGPDMAVFDYAGVAATSTCDDVTGLAPGASCTVAVRARRNTDGYYTANLEISEATSSVVVSMTGAASQNTVCAPGKLGFGGIIVSCIDSTTPYYVLTGSGCGTGTAEPACTNTPGVAVDPKFTLIDTVSWATDNYDLITQNREGDKNTVNMLTYSAGWNAATYCNNLVKGGYSNWYLPSADEWMTIIAPLRSQLMLDDANQAYWTSTFGYMEPTSFVPYHFSYMRTANEVQNYNSGSNNYNTRCLRKHGESMPAAAADTSINRPRDYYQGAYDPNFIGTVFRPLYSISLSTQLEGVATTVVGINTTVPVLVTGPGTPEFRSRPPAGAWSAYGTSGIVGPGYEIQLRATTPPAAGQEYAINVSVGNGNHIWKVRAIQAATRRIFVTSTTYNGNLGGLSGADANCATRATAASLGGTWYALIGGRGTSAFDRVPWNWNRLETMAGVQVAANMGDLQFSVPLLAAINRNESNAATTTTNVWTGMYRQSPFYASEVYDNICANATTGADWGSNAAGRQGRIGTINNTTNWMGANTQNACNQTRRLYCVGPF